MTQTQQSETTVRPAKHADVQDISRMVHALAAHHGDEPDIDAEQIAEFAFSSQPVVQILVAELNGQMCGYAALLPRFQLQTGRAGTDLHHLYVDPDARGLGIGKALIIACRAEAFAKGSVFLTVGTDPGNTEAHRYYCAQGFQRSPAPGPRFFLKLDGCAQA